MEDYKPMVAIVVYAASKSDYYLESHEIGTDGKLMEGKPLMEETIAGIVETFYGTSMQSSTVKGLMPDNVLHFSPLTGGKYKMIWYRPAEVRTLYFDDSLKIPDGSAWVPAMVYKVEDSSLEVYALMGDTRPTESTVLYKAPFHNVTDGDVCLGSAKARKPTDKTYANVCKYWEDMFWLSRFTHISGECPTKTNLNMLWIRCIENPSLKWDMLDELIPQVGKGVMKDRGKLTIKDIL